METLIQDLRYAVRALSRSPGFTVVAVTVLALGIGANTAIFSTLNAVAFATLPYSEPDRLVQILSTGPASEDPPTFMLSGNEVIEYRSQNSVFEYVAGYRNREMDYRGSFEPVTLSAASVTSDFFRMFGYEAALGRTFGPEHENRSSRGTIVVSDRFWRRYLGADPNAIGKSVRLNRNDSIVVGVLEPGYTHVEGENADIFIVVALDTQEALQARWLTVVARMKAGVSTEQVQAELDLIAPRVEEKYPDRNEGWSTSVAPLRPLLAGEVNPLLYVLLGSVFLVLLIACANVTNLFLFRAVTREREIAVRSAMGAGRGRLGREVLTESTLVALLGGGGGLMLALWGMRALVPLFPQDVLGVTAVPIDGRVLLFAVGMTVLTAIVVGLAPALHASRRNISGCLTDASRGRMAVGGRETVRRLLVVSEVAIAMVLLVGAGLLMRSFLDMRSVDLGFQTENVLTMQVRPSWALYDGRPDPAFYSMLLERVAALPGVVQSGATSRLPMRGRFGGWSVRAEAEAPDPENQYDSGLKLVGGSYFQAMGIPLLKGRNVGEQDSRDAPSVVIINDLLARLLWPGEDPIGRRIAARRLSMEVVGVVGNVKDTLEGAAAPLFYVPYRQFLGENQPRMLVIRAEGDPLVLVDAIHPTAADLDPGMIVNDIATLDQIKGGFITPQRFSMLLLGIFAGVAVVLAAAGIYGVMSYSVSQRTQEIGGRRALGAEAGDLRSMVVRQGLKLIAIGLGIGLVVAVALTRTLSNLLWGVTATDPVTIGAVILILATVGMLACYLPALRATRIDPVAALRYE